MQIGQRSGSISWRLLLPSVVALVAVGAPVSAQRDDVDGGNIAVGAPEIRLAVPTSIESDPLAQSSDVDSVAVTSQPAAAPWTDLPDYPDAVFDARTGLSYVLGGNDGTQVADAMWWYRDDLGEWWPEGNTVLPRQAPAIGTRGGGEMVMAGGWDENGQPSGSAFYYDDASVEWVSELPAMPTPRAAAGYASFGEDGDLYVVGGCTTAQCVPVSSSVFNLPWSGQWSAVAEYPVSVAFPSCGAWKERIYCTGGHNGSDGISDSYVYDRRTDAWTPLPDPPTDSWGAQHAMADGILVVSGGVQGGEVTNNTFGFNVRTGAWVDLPNATTPRYRGAGGCRDLRPGGQFISVGGLDGSDDALAQAEALPGFSACGEGSGVPSVARDDGEDRYGTAAAIARSYPGPVDTLFVTTGETFPDALAAAARAGSLEAPILLTRPESLPEQTRDELARLAPQNVIVVGGPGAVTDDAVRLIEDASGADSVRRIAGANRYDTAATVAQEVESANTVFIATGADFPDAMVGAAWASALDAPLLLAQGNRLPEVTVAQLDRLSPAEIIVLGGRNSISDSVVTQLGAYGAVERVAGANRWETSALVADRYPRADVPGTQLVGVASGRSWPDALTGSARAGGIEVPVILVDTDRIPPQSDDALRRVGPTAIEVYGGEGVVSRSVFRKLRALYD